MMLPLEDASDANENDRLRTSQLYPGAVSRKLWTLMQSPSTKDGMLNQQKWDFQIQPLYPNFLVIIKDLLNAGLLRMTHHKVIIAIGGRPKSTDETKLWKSLRVSAYNFRFTINLMLQHPNTLFPF